MIRFILITIFGCIMLYALTQRRRDAWFSLGVLALGTVGILLTLHPEWATAMANWVGVGRGTDFVLYGWIMGTCIYALHLHSAHRRLEAQITALTRRLALDEAEEPMRVEKD